MRGEWERILAEARQVDEQEEQAGVVGATRLLAPVEREQMREILRRVRKQLAPVKRAAAAAKKEAAAQKKGAERAAQAAKPPRAGGKSASVAAPEAEAAAPAAQAAVAAAGGAPPAATGEGERGLPAGDEAAAARTVSGASRLAPPPADAAEPAPSAVPIAARPPLTRRMRARVEAAVAALDAAMAEGRKHLCLTDPDARMMGEGRSRRVQECYRFEVAVDRAAGLLVAASVTQDASDNARLEPLVEQAKAHEPEGVKAADGDSGYFSGGAVGRLIRAGVDTCVPDCNTAGDLHRGQPAGTIRAQGRGSVVFAYDAEADCYRCPEGNELRREQTREEAGQKLTEYRAHRSCAGCPLAAQCLTQEGAQHRTLKVSEYEKELTWARERFNEPEHRERYRHRGEVVETVFGFVRGTLGYVRWLLRGKERVECEARWIKVGYQLRKVQAHWSGV